MLIQDKQALKALMSTAYDTHEFCLKWDGKRYSHNVASLKEKLLKAEGGISSSWPQIMNEFGMIPGGILPDAEQLKSCAVFLAHTNGGGPRDSCERIRQAVLFPQARVGVYQEPHSKPRSRSLSRSTRRFWVRENRRRPRSPRCPNPRRQRTSLPSSRCTTGRTSSRMQSKATVPSASQTSESLSAESI